MSIAFSNALGFCLRGGRHRRLRGVNTTDAFRWFATNNLVVVEVDERAVEPAVSKDSGVELPVCDKA